MLYKVYLSDSCLNGSLSTEDVLKINSIIFGSENIDAFHNEFLFAVFYNERIGFTHRFSPFGSKGKNSISTLPKKNQKGTALSTHVKPFWPSALQTLLQLRAAIFCAIPPYGMTLELSTGITPRGKKQLNCEHYIPQKFLRDRAQAVAGFLDPPIDTLTFTAPLL
jgi:hypothetical protein